MSKTSIMSSQAVSKFPTFDLEKAATTNGVDLMEQYARISSKSQLFSRNFEGDQKFETERNKVFRIKFDHICQDFIIKISSEMENEEHCSRHQISEIYFLALLKVNPCPSLIRIENYWFLDKKLVCLMEYACGGDLSKYIRRNSFFLKKEQKVEKVSWGREVIRQVVSSLEFIHKMGFVYRDLKPSNLLVTHEGKIKLCDFEFVIKHFQVDSSLCGTPEYMAPERLSATKRCQPIDYSVDMWSLGILLYQLLMGNTPYSYQGDIQELTNQFYGGYLSFDKDFPESARNLIFNLIQTNPKKRLTLSQVQEHPFLSQDSQELWCKKWWKCGCQDAH